MQVECFLAGNQIGTYQSLKSGGNNNDMTVKLSGVQALGSANEYFRVVVRQVNNGQENFSNGQWVDIYRYPDDSPNPKPIFSSLNPQHDQFQGRAAASDHMVFTSKKIVFDLKGVTVPSMQYGPGPQGGQLPFKSMSTPPRAAFCFTPGALIAVPDGLCAVEDLRLGDLVMTADHGPQPLRWIGRTKAFGHGPLAPVVIDAGALGNRRTMRVSQQHRMLVADARAHLWFAEPEVLVAAKHLVNDRTIRIEPQDSVTYLHLAFDAHEVIFAEGIPTESLHLGSRMDAEQQAEISLLFPDFAERLTARPCLRGWEAALVAA